MEMGDGWLLGFSCMFSLPFLVLQGSFFQCTMQSWTAWCRPDGFVLMQSQANVVVKRDVVRLVSIQYQYLWYVVVQQCQDFLIFFGIKWSVGRSYGPSSFSQSSKVPDQSLPLTPDPTPPEEGRRLDEVFGSGRRSSSWRRMVGLHLTDALGYFLDCLTRRQVDRFRADFVFAEHHGCDSGALNTCEAGLKKVLQQKETISY